MTETILLQVIGVLMLTTDLTPQAWVLIALILIGVGGLVAWIVGRAALVWKRVFKE